MVNLMSLKYRETEGMGIHKEAYLGIQGQLGITLSLPVINTRIHGIQSRITILNSHRITRCAKHIDIPAHEKEESRKMWHSMDTSTGSVVIRVSHVRRMIGKEEMDMHHVQYVLLIL